VPRVSEYSVAYKGNDAYSLFGLLSDLGIVCRPGSPAAADPLPEIFGQALHGPL